MRECKTSSKSQILSTINQEYFVDNSNFKKNLFSSLSIRSKLFIGFGVIIILVVFMAVGTFWNLKKLNQLHDLVNVSNQIKIYMLKGRRNEKDFFLRQDLKYVVLHTLTIDSMNLMCTKLQEGKWQRTTLEKIDSMAGAIKAYNREFSNIVVLWQKKGLDENSGLQGSFRAATHTIENSIKEHSFGSEIQAQLLLCRRREKDYIMRKDFSYIEKFQNDAVKLKDLLKGKGDGSLLAQVDKYVSDFMSMTVIDKEIATATEKLRQEIHKLEPIIESVVAEVEKETKDSNNFTITILLTTSLLVILVSIAIALVLIRMVIHPLNQLKSLAAEIAAKDLHGTIIIDRSDEFGSLLESFKLMVENLRMAFSNIMQSTNTVASSSTELSAVSAQFASNTEELSTQTSTVASATEQATTNINSISSAAEEMSSSATSVATAIEELSASLNEVSRNCQKELQIAAEANTHAKNSKDVMYKLGSAAKSIGKVIEVINDIADQTNLLALNATIEAVSAGAAGKGFAVVAGEVKELAKQTAQATQEIKKQIEDMQTNTESAVLAIEAVSKVIEEVNVISQIIVSAVEEQSATVNEISKNVSCVSTGAKEVSKNVAESATGLSEISSTIVGINNAIADTAKGIMQVKTSAEELSKLSENLKELTGQFKI